MTLDEVELTIRGNEDLLRFHRLCSYKVVEGWRGSKGMPAVIDFIKLPYDFEIAEMPLDAEKLMAYYESVKATWN